MNCKYEPECGKTRHCEECADGSGSRMSALLNATALQEIANAVCRHVPEGCEVSLHMENGAAWVEATKHNGATNVAMPDSADKTLLEQLNDGLCAVNGWSV